MTQGVFQRAVSELIGRGWITVETPGGFQQKTRHATAYRLASEVMRAEASPSKAYLRWRRDENRGTIW